MKNLSRHIALLLLTGIVYSILNYCLDIVFFHFHYDRPVDERHSPVLYALYFYLLYIFLAIPLLILYSLGFEEIAGGLSRIKQYGLAMAIGLLFGLALHRSGVSLYIGDFRPLKNAILYPLLFVILEALRSKLLNKRKREADYEG